MKLIALALASLALVACSSPAPQDSPDADAAPTIDAAVPDAGPASDAALADAGFPPCNPGDPLRLDEIAPALGHDNTIAPHGQVIIFAYGCGFKGMRDVQVNVQSVRFEVYSDTGLGFVVPAVDIETTPELPHTVQVDFIKVQPDQVQGSITYDFQPNP